jgi:hypothetical protein
MVSYTVPGMKPGDAEQPDGTLATAGSHTERQAAQAPGTH